MQVIVTVRHYGVIEHIGNEHQKRCLAGFCSAGEIVKIRQRVLSCYAGFMFSQFFCIVFFGSAVLTPFVIAKASGLQAAMVCCYDEIA